VSTKDFSWGKGGRCVSLMSYHTCSAESSRKSGALTYPEPLGPDRPIAGDLYFFFNFCGTTKIYCACVGRPVLLCNVTTSGVFIASIAGLAFVKIMLVVLITLGQNVVSDLLK